MPCLKNSIIIELFHPFGLYSQFFIIEKDDNPINNPLFVGQGGVMKARERNSIRSIYMCDVL